MNTIFEKLINGNLTAAKKGARRYSYVKLANFARMELGWTAAKAIAAAYYLKFPGPDAFDRFCNCEEPHL